MSNTEYEIALATNDDVNGIIELQERNLSKNGGSLSVPFFSKEWFERASADAQVIVARRNGGVVGYLVFSSFAAQAHVPLVQAMVKAYSGTPDAYNYGPVCVAENERARGVAGAMFAGLKARLPNREGIAFILRSNEASLLAHKKMGMKEVSEFTHDSVAFAVVSYGRHCTDQTIASSVSECGN